MSSYCHSCLLFWGFKRGEPVPLSWVHLWWPSHAPTSPVGTFPRAGWGRGPSTPPRSTNPGSFALCLCQALSLKESEKTALSEKLMGTQHSLSAISLEMERQKRDAQSRQEQDRVGGPPSEPGDTALPGGAPVRGGAWLCPGEAPRL